MYAVVDAGMSGRWCQVSVLCGSLQRFLVSLFLKVGVCVAGDCVCCLYAWVGCGCGWVLAVGWVQCFLLT